MIVDHMPTPTPRSGWGESILQRAQRTATCDVARGIHVLGADAASATSCQCGRPFKTSDPMPLPTPQTVGVARNQVPQGFDDGNWLPRREWRAFNGDRSGIENPFADGGAWTSHLVPQAPLRDAAPGLVLQSGDEQITLHPTSVTPGFDGSSATLRIVAPLIDSQFTALENLHRARALLHVDGGGPYAMVERSYAASKTSETWTTMTLVLKKIQLAVPRMPDLLPANRPTDENTTCPATFGGSMHTYIPGAERCFCGEHQPPPYAPGDEVEWRTGPLGCWRAGRVTSIVDDRPNDGIDKPFWVVRVDTANERRFSGPAVAVCLRRLAEVPVA